MSKDDLRPLRLLPWWAAVLGIAAVALSVSVTTLWLLSIAGGNPNLRFEAIKIGLSVGAGTGAGFALMLAFRRQWLSERSQAHVEDVARASAYDAAQRRITELYGRAVEQLGHERAAVRLGGLYSLERLAQDEPEHRQTVAGVVCAYLRMPFQLPRETSFGLSHDTADTVSEIFLQSRTEDTIGSSLSKEELQVRLAAQRLLARHLAIPVINGELAKEDEFLESYWRDIRVDLTGALLVNFDFSWCRTRDIDFRGARFRGNAAFQGAHFDGTISFLGAEFAGGAWFKGARFRTHAGFHGASFRSNAWFQDARFTATVSFRRAKFSAPAVFGGAVFEGNASFDGALFDEDAGFRGAHFGGPCGFRGTQFRKAAIFRAAQFRGDARFDLARFGGDARFNNAELRKLADFKGALFSRNAAFQRAQFGGAVQFGDAQFNGMPRFGHAYANPANRHTWPVGWCVGQPSPESLMSPLIHDPAIGIEINASRQTSSPEPTV